MSQYINFKNVQVNPNIVLSIDEAGQTVDSIKRGQRIVSIITTILTYVFILALALTVLFPFYWMIITSLKQKAEIEATSQTFFPNIVMYSSQNARHIYIRAF